MTECCCDDIVIEVSEEGIDGVGIASIELVSTVGITKNYRINLTNGTYFDYSISDGSSIASISKTSSAGLVDTYTVLLTSGDTTTFEVTNGNGIASIVKTSTDNLTDTYTISYTNGTTSTFSVVNGNSIASVSKVSTQVLTDTYQITYTDEDKSPDSFTVVNGRGITSIAKTSTSGLVDTYTITYNDNTTTTFTVTNGEKGDKGDTGDTGNGIASISLLSESGLVKTYRITMTDGTHFDFDVTDGEKGDTGETGATGNGITSIEKTATVGLVDTYTITFTDGTTTTFDVTNGSDMWGNITGTLSDQTDLQEALDAKAPVILSSASGSIVSFTDGAPLPVEDLTVAIEPVQSGTGDPSPGTPITLPAFEQGTINGSGNLENSSKRVRTSDFFVANGSNYRIEFDADKVVTVRVYSPSGPYLPDESITSWTVSPISLTITNGRKAKVVLAYSDNSNIAPSDVTKCVVYENVNIRPISGHSTATVPRTGKSLLEPAMNITTKNGVTFTQNSDGTITTSGAPTENFSGTFPAPFSIAKINTLKPGTYRLSGCPSGGSSSTYKLSVWNSPSASQLAVDYGSGVTFTIPETPHSYYVRITIYKNVDVTGFVWKPMITKVEDDTTYEPYQGTSVTIDLNGTRYGGTLDMTTGQMTVDRQMVTFDGSEGWSVSNTGTANWYYKVASGITPKSGASDLFKSNLYPFASIGNSNTNQGFGVQSNGEIRVRFGTEDTDVNWKAYLSTQNLQVIIPLASPVTVDLNDPHALSTLRGQNHIFADTGDVEATYRADSKMYIDQQIAKSQRATRSLIAGIETEMVASKNYVIGDLLIVGDTLYTVTANIGSGSAITVGTNVTATTVAEQLIALANA